jgi:cell division protein FtsN
MGAKSDVAVKLVLVFFISLLSFSIGTYIGKKYSDNQHKLAQLEPAADQEKGNHDEKRSVASEHGEGHAIPAKDQMISDDEIKNLAEEKLKKEEFIADDSEADAHGEKHGDAHGAKPADKHGEKVAADKHDAHGAAIVKEEKREPAKAGHAAEKAVEKPVEKTVEKADKHETPAHKPVGKHSDVHEDAPLEAAKSFLDGKVPAAKEAAKVENRLPSSLPKDISQYALGKFTVQVASYASKDEAEKRATKLKEQGYQTNVIPAKVADKQWYRVSFGLYGTQEEANTERSKYLEKYKTESALVQKIKN